MFFFFNEVLGAFSYNYFSRLTCLNVCLLRAADDC